MRVIVARVSGSDLVKCGSDAVAKHIPEQRGQMINKSRKLKKQNFTVELPELCEPQKEDDVK